jgi:hypothetical protein
VVRHFLVEFPHKSPSIPKTEMMRFSAGLLVLAAAILACQAQELEVRPDARFVEWNKICDDIKSVATILEYNQSVWDIVGSYTDIEGLDYTTLTQTLVQDKISAIQKILSGGNETTYQPSWDCYINHYGSKSFFFWFSVCVHWMHSSAFA